MLEKIDFPLHGENMKNMKAEYWAHLLETSGWIFLMELAVLLAEVLEVIQVNMRRILMKPPPSIMFLPLLLPLLFVLNQTSILVLYLLLGLRALCNLCLAPLRKWAL